MLAYASRPRRGGSPRTLLLVAAGHALALALLLTARGEYAARTKSEVPDITFIEPLKPPPPPPPAPSPTPPREAARSTIDRPPVITPTPAPPAERIDSGPPVTSVDPLVGIAVIPPQRTLALPQPVFVRTAARFITPADDVRPPYPAAKQRLEEEASLRLTLAIDPRGRVVAVDPVGAADPAFLDSARRHILRHWRYQPATAGGEAIASRIVITLRFELER